MKSFFSKKSILGTMAVAAVCMLGTGNAQAQEFTIQGDLVSSYVWRGIYQGLFLYLVPSQFWIKISNTNPPI